ncbi:MAG TPA: AI-2E family transporter [Gammaproteobacteria bacterium]|nr:AI-2E family transporter [Gammaproteobacteria bacterium]
MTDTQRFFALLSVAGTGLLLYLLAPILTPFLIGAALAYIGDPLVDSLEARHLPRALAVTAVFLVMVLVFVAGVVLVLPLLQQQVAALVARLPGYLDWIQATAMPWLHSVLGLARTDLDVAGLKQALTQHWQQVGGLAAGLLGSITRSWLALLAWVANLVLIPLVTFYLLRDWDLIVARIRELIPRRFEPAVVQIARECDEVLGGFMRGQLAVMLVLGTTYALGLWWVGLELAFLIGFGAGMVSFVPYLGFILGVLVAGIAAAAQFQDVIHVIYVLLVFAVGQALESMLLTPLLLGDRIGLHPVGVIFAVMAGGQLFGFVGVLLALPVAAVVMVMLRHAHERYVRSGLYGGDRDETP